MKRISSCQGRIVAACLGIGALSGAAQAQWTVSGSDAYFNLSGHLGVGVTSPAYKLQASESASADGSRAIYGYVGSTTGVTNGVYGQTASNAGRGVIGLASATSGTNYGVYGQSSSTDGRGVYGLAPASTGQTYGLYGQCNSTSGTGAFGWARATDGDAFGVLGQSDSIIGIGVYGYASSADVNSFLTAGVQGETAGHQGRGVVGLATDTTTSTIGVLGQSNSSTGSGVYGNAAATSGVNIGVIGQTHSGSGYGVYGTGGTFTVYGNGNTGASGTKSFRIDHPADPGNKYLLHYSMESPEVLNSYSGKVVLDGAGTAIVKLPAYFAAINTDPRYMLTPVGSPMPLLHVDREVSEKDLATGAQAEPAQVVPECWFSIAGGVPGGRVSWRIEAVRNDRWVRTHGAPVEVEKLGVERGTYLQPELFGKPPELGFPCGTPCQVSGMTPAKN